VRACVTIRSCYKAGFFGTFFLLCKEIYFKVIQIKLHKLQFIEYECELLFFDNLLGATQKV